MKDGENVPGIPGVPGVPRVPSIPRVPRVPGVQVNIVSFLLLHKQSDLSRGLTGVSGVTPKQTSLSKHIKVTEGHECFIMSAFQ